ncbi:hypothetical protein CEXT_379401 [Caerostris extrusa]|uniref:Uncharacterized protein n=1 Tax=Caerostris extrusa TaxID=172846 RepID=A0AAV4YAE3_CAEEX|nr:hypothetical protein CEXT_379401 [Caerostris extrusa]
MFSVEVQEKDLNHPDTANGGSLFFALSNFKLNYLRSETQETELCKKTFLTSHKGRQEGVDTTLYPTPLVARSRSSALLSPISLLLSSFGPLEPRRP